jgi:hypothetical protein
METKFTSGVWLQSHRENKSTGMYSTEVYDSRGQTICTLAWHTEPESTRTDRPENAALIAAAPDMYAALDELTNTYIQLIDSGDCGNWNPREDEEIINSLAALKKARGE